MKVSTKPISSPSRTEKYPPPLMRFLKSNVGSRSRGRSRMSPMFVRKKNSVIETQEPSSPKVTCIGQVRVRRSSKNSGSRKSKTQAKNRRCWFVRKALFFHYFVQKLRPRSFHDFRPVLRKCVLFFRFGYCKKVEISEDSSKMETNRIDKHRTTESTESENEEEDEEDKEIDLKITEMAFSSSSPPKNALLLTRCRSAPYRSSSQLNRFLVSPLSKLETGDENEEQKSLQQVEEIRENERPTLDRDPDCRESEGKLGISKEFGGSIDGKIKEVELLGSSGRPLILTRCKSEPAKTGERLNLHVCD